MEALIYFVVWAAAIFLMMRYGCGAHVMGHRHSRQQDGSATGQINSENLRWVPPAKDVDPVCGKTVSTDRAKPTIHDGHVYYFCSRDCREIFEASPGQHTGPETRYLQSGMEKHHA